MLFYKNTLNYTSCNKQHTQYARTRNKTMTHVNMSINIDMLDIINNINEDVDVEESFYAALSLNPEVANMISNGIDEMRAESTLTLPADNDREAAEEAAEALYKLLAEFDQEQLRQFSREVMVGQTHYRCGRLVSSAEYVIKSARPEYSVA